MIKVWIIENCTEQMKNLAIDSREVGGTFVFGAEVQMKDEDEVYGMIATDSDANIPNMYYLGKKIYEYVLNEDLAAKMNGINIAIPLLRHAKHEGTSLYGYIHNTIIDGARKQTGKTMSLVAATKDIIPVLDGIIRDVLPKGVFNDDDINATIATILTSVKGSIGLAHRMQTDIREVLEDSSITFGTEERIDLVCSIIDSMRKDILDEVLDEVLSNRMKYLKCVFC